MDRNDVNWRGYWAAVPTPFAADGSLALDLAWTACGRLDAMYEHDTHPWDLSAGIAMLEAAGGVAKITGSMIIAAGNETLLQRLEELVLDGA